MPMKQYNYSNFTLEIPADWEDQSITAFSAPKDNKAIVPNIVITIDHLQNNETLESYTDRQLVEIVKRLNNFKLLKKNSYNLDYLKGIEINYTWTSSNGSLFQKLVLLLNREDEITNFTVTTSENDYSEYESIFDDILRSVKFY